MWSVAAALVLVPCIYLLGSLAGIATSALVAEVRLNREVRDLVRGRL
ncbi:hypothetical protein GCM10010170_012810 [Dactylosporangium salmoneum]|uniref:Uncharacterized protein n=1 Tax=Dactylosporangium salmoneum TaxID=53361 RepID=A0ABN3FMP0_9ACTN